jgi:predicted XRE-type DNA-binding protein
MKRRRKESEFRAGSGNVFTDLRVPDAGQELVKADLAKAICALVAGRELRQVDLAARLGISQPKVSLLLRGRTEGFSTEMLMRLLNRLGQRIEIVVTPAPRARLIGDTRVDHRSAMLLEHAPPAYGAARSSLRTRGKVGVAKARAKPKGV